MDRIAISVCTYNRPEGLDALLTSLMRQRLDRLHREQVEIIVVDNSDSGSAAPVCERWSVGRFPVHYRQERRKGLAHARNACLDAANELGTTHIAFIDDDEVAHPAWIETLHGALETTGADAALGPVFPIFEVPPPRALPVEAFAKRPRMEGNVPQEGYTCNAILTQTAIDACGLRFDARFNETGGEDTMFFKSLSDRGGRLAWAEQACVHEFVPRSRMKVAWLWRRWYRTGNNEIAFSLSGKGGLAPALQGLYKGGIRVGFGSARVLYSLAAHSWRRPDAFTASFYTLCRGSGFLASAIGSSYREYSRPDYR